MFIKYLLWCCCSMLVFSMLVVAAEELWPCSPNECGASNYCKVAKYDVAEFGVLKSMPNKSVIHSWVVVVTDSPMWPKVWRASEGVENIDWGCGISKYVCSTPDPATFWVIAVYDHVVVVQQTRTK